MGLSLKELNDTLENMKSNPQSAGIPLASGTNAGLLSPDEKKYIDGLVNGQYTFNDKPDPGLTSKPDIIGMINQAYTNASSVNKSLSDISINIGKITNGGGSSTPVGTATVDDVLSTVTFSSATAGIGKTGNIKVYNSTEGSSIISDSMNTILPLPEQIVAFKVPKGYYDGTAVLGVGDDNFKKANIVAGATIFGLAGEYIGTTTTTLAKLNNQADQNSILAGKSAYSSDGTTTSVVGGNIINHLHDTYAISIYADGNGALIPRIPLGAYLEEWGGTGVTEIHCHDDNFIESNIKEGVSIFGLIGKAISGYRVKYGHLDAPLGGNYDQPGFTVTGVGFTPKIVIFLSHSSNIIPSGMQPNEITIYMDGTITDITCNLMIATNAPINPVYVNPDGFRSSVSSGALGGTIYWVCIG